MTHKWLYEEQRALRLQDVLTLAGALSLCRVVRIEILHQLGASELYPFPLAFERAAVLIPDLHQDKSGITQVLGPPTKDSHGE